MDNLPKDPPDDNNPTPPPFGSSFDPHSNPIDPNNPYQSSPQPPQTPFPDNNNPDEIKHEHYSEAAQQKPRDTHGHFIHSEDPSPSSQNPPSHPSSFLPPIIEVNQNTEPSSKKDPPLFGFFLTNPVTYLKAFLNRLIKRQAITIKIPVLAIIVFMVGIGGFGLGFQSGINWALFKIFPNYSPILHREITQQGIIQKSSKGYFLQANDKNKTIWNLQSASANVKLADYVNQNVQVKGNLTSTPNLIDVSEVISFETKPTPIPSPNTSKILSEVEEPNLSNPADLPKLYSNLTWEITQSKTLTFTSGERRIEQEGVYLESSQVTEIPQDFINYYTNELTNLGFKQTFNSSEPNGTTITVAKDELFLTFGVKNVFSGSGDSKKIVGYKAFIEHN